MALRQLRALGLTGSGVRKRVASGRLHRVHAGVYAVGHANLTGHGHWMAAVLACGQGAVLSYRSSAALHGVRPDHRSVIDVTSSRRSGRGRREERFLLICRGAGVPAPDVNAWVALPDEELKADFLWRHHRLIVEVDGHETHGTRQAFERDRRRDQCLTLAGYSVIRFTWHQIINEPARVAATLRALLAQRAA